MSRIRSIHPGLFTDEAFMSASIPARVLIIGIWTEAWDDGVFEWKPLTLKARIFPADPVNVEELLGELTALGFIGPFEMNSKKYGAIRNFRKWQRPKKPNSSGVLPPDLVLYVGKSETDPELVPNQFGTGGEKSPQREDGGGKREEIKEDEAASAASSASAPVLDLKEVERRCVQATGWESTTDFSPIAGLITEGFDFDDRILPMLRTIAGQLRSRKAPPPHRWKFAVSTIRDMAQQPAGEPKSLAFEWVEEDSPRWREIVAITKKESLMRLQLQPINGKQCFAYYGAAQPGKQRAAA